MSDSTEHHLEHAEHAQHHDHNPFSTRVAVTMAVLAALLAGVALASHRGHTETLQLATQADTFHTKANDEWNLYQAKNIRSNEYQAFLMMVMLLDKGEKGKQDEMAQAVTNYWITLVDRYQGDGYWAKFVELLPNYRDRSNKDKASEFLKVLKDKDKEKPREMPNSELAELAKKAKALEEQAKAKEHESHELHGMVTYIDIGHLGLELALVFCAVSVLTKSGRFWIMGIVLGVLGSGVALYGMILWRYFLGAGHH
jgi:hypothetical protein